MKYIFIILIIPFIFLSCNLGSKDIPVLDFASALRHPEEFNLADYIDSIEYIPLETTEDCMLSAGINVQMTSEYFYVRTYPYYNGQVYQFDRKGKFIRLIGKLGYGPEEYNELMGYTVSPDGRFVYIWNRHDVLKYDSCGRFLHRFEKIDKKLGQTLPSSMISTSRGEFIIRMSERAFTDQAAVVYDSDFNLVSDFKREVVRDKKGIVPIAQWIDFDGNNFYYKEDQCDTLFKIDKDLNRTPFLIFDLGNERPVNDSFDSYEQLDGKRWFDRFYLFSDWGYFVCTNKFPRGEADNFIYLYSSGRLIYLKPNQAPLQMGNIAWYLISHSQDILVFRADLVSLLDHSNQILDPEFKRLAATLDENSNPVLAIVKVKLH